MDERRSREDMSWLKRRGAEIGQESVYGRRSQPKHLMSTAISVMNENQLERSFKDQRKSQGKVRIFHEAREWEPC